MDENKYACPACAKPLTKTLGAYGPLWKCESCARELISISTLKKMTKLSFVNELWREGRLSAERSGACPFCGNPMARLGRKEPSLVFEFCFFCEMIALGPAEKTALPPLAAIGEGETSPLPPEAAEMTAKLASRMISERGEREAQPEEWDWIFWLFGLPTQPGGVNWTRFPWATAFLVLITIGLGIFSPYSNDNPFLIGGFNPLDIWTSRSNYSGGFLYLIRLPLLDLFFTMYLLVCFGASIENKVGPFHFLTIFFMPTLLSAGFSFFPGSTMVWHLTTGGGVAAVMVFFAFSFPQRKIFWRFGSCRALYVIYFWFLFKIVFALVPGDWHAVVLNTQILGGLCGWIYWAFIGRQFGLNWNREDDF